MDKENIRTLSVLPEEEIFVSKEVRLKLLLGELQ
jgi:hypothetical protein